MYRTVSKNQDSTTRRSRLQLCLDVLEAIGRGVERPTNIMYRSNLSWVTLDEILDSLLDQRLIEMKSTGTHKVYQITEKGQDVLRYFRMAQTLLVAKAERG